MENILLLLCLSFADYKQSVDMFEHQSGYYELNPALGTHPTNKSLVAFGVAGNALAYAANLVGKEIGLGDLVIDSIITTELWNVEANQRLIDLKETRNTMIIAVTLKF